MTKEPGLVIMAAGGEEEGGGAGCLEGGEAGVKTGAGVEVLAGFKTAWLGFAI